MAKIVNNHGKLLLYTNNILKKLGLKIISIQARPKQKMLSKQEIEKWGLILGRELHLVYTDVLWLENLLEFGKKHPDIAQKFASAFNYLNKLLYDSLYFKICRLLDEGKDVVSLPLLFKRCGHDHGEKWKEIKSNEIFIKVQKFRHKMLAHLDEKLALNQDSTDHFYESNKVYLSSIDEFLVIINESLEKVYESIDCPTVHIGLGKGPETEELRKILHFLEVSYNSLSV